MARKLRSPLLTPGAMDRLLPSLRYTIRLLLRSPGFTVTAILILGLGIGANTAIFSLINTVILKPLPYPEPEQLVQIYMPTSTDSTIGVDYPDYLAFYARQHSFDSLSVEYLDEFNLSGDGSAERVLGALISASNFRVDGLPFTL